ncbi:hypothetical protein BKM20_26200 [Pseudomonas avellanae]|nr:hypothetical protein BKM20_26200 [Pseudomonas avellanae]
MRLVVSLVTPLAEPELDVGHRTLHALGLAVAEDEVAFGVHQVDELRNIVQKHRGEKVFAEVR